MRRSGTCPPHRGRFVAYYRVSTQRQGESGLGLAAQLQGGRGLSQRRLVAARRRVHRGGERQAGSDRPATRRCSGAYASGSGPSWSSAKLDRLSRNLAFLATLMERGVDFIACDNPHATKLTIHILAAVATARARDDQSAHQGCACGSEGFAARSSAARSCGRRGRPRCACASAQADQRAANIVPIIRDVQRAGLTSLPRDR